MIKEICSDCGRGVESWAPARRLPGSLDAIYFEIAAGGVVSICVQKLLLSCFIWLALASSATAGTTFLVFPLENQTKLKTIPLLYPALQSILGLEASKNAIYCCLFI